MKVLEDNHLVSLQLNTSKPDAYIKLQILDHEVEMASAVGKGHVVLPSYLLLRDNMPMDEMERRPSSRSCMSEFFASNPFKIALVDREIKL